MSKLKYETSWEGFLLRNVLKSGIFFSQKFINSHVTYFYTPFSLLHWTLSFPFLSEFQWNYFIHSFFLMNIAQQYCQRLHARKSSPRAFIRNSFDKWCRIILPCVNIGMYLHTNFTPDCNTYRASRQKVSVAHNGWSGTETLKAER